MMIWNSRRAFLKALRSTWVPLVREDGFKGSSPTFRRTIGNTIQVINLQHGRPTSTLREHSCVNIGCHLTYLPLGTGALPNTQNIKESECEFRTRLTPNTSEDYWWSWGGWEIASRNSASALAQTYKRRGREILFEALSIEDDLLSVSIQDFEHQSSPFRNPGAPSRRALIIARIALHHNNKPRGRAFAEFGLLNCPDRATTLRSHLEKVLEESL